MQLDISQRSLPVYEALSSSVRLRILQIITEKDYGITELSEELNMSKAIITKHIQKLEAAHLVVCKKVPGKSGAKKVPHLAVDNIEITFPAKIYHSYQLHTSTIRLGHFSNFEVKPTCGLVTPDEIVGKLDDPFAFVNADRVNASLLWFSEGFVEYKVPNSLTEDQELQMLEFSMEIASEFPYSNNIWPSDISFYINNILVGVWTCPGNFSDARGYYTPDWWEDDLSQYGLLKHIRINNTHCNIDGESLSDVTLPDLKIKENRFIDFRIAVSSNALNKGGVTLFGKEFGNYPQDITANLYYT